MKLKRPPIEIPFHEFNGQQQLLPYDLPPGRKGSYRIETEIKPIGKVLPVVSHRNAFLSGQQPVNLKLAAPLLLHRLRYHPNAKDHGVWMTTYPQEVEQHVRQLRNAHGHVLIGGLGLGLAVGILQQNAKIKSITVVEKAKAVIDLVEPHLPRIQCGVNVIHGDLFAHLAAVKLLGDGYDFAFYDIWAPTGQRVLTSHTMPLRQLSIGVVAQDQIECWNEDEMIAQAIQGIATRLMFPQLIDPMFGLPDKEFAGLRDANRECFPFYNWLRYKKHRPDGVHAKMGVQSYTAALKDAEIWNLNWAQYAKPIRAKRKALA